jgi:hypothetical protein
MATPFLRLLSRLALLFALGSSSVLASTPPGELHHQTYTSTLEYLNGKYASIFGLVPKEGKLSLKEERVIVREQAAGERGFTLQLVSSNVRRVLEIPDELPILVADPKPLTGRTLKVSEQDGSWKVNIVGLESPTPVELREGDRLAARFHPDASPFPTNDRDPSKDLPLDLAKVLTYLGYVAPREMLGEAILVGQQQNGSAADQSEGSPLRIRSIFTMGEGLEEVTVELNAEGVVVLGNGTAECQKVQLAGSLAVAGRRKLEDGRIVPYNIFTDFKYAVERKEGSGNEAEMSVTD